MVRVNVPREVGVSTVVVGAVVTESATEVVVTGTIVVEVEVEVVVLVLDVGVTPPVIAKETTEVA